MTVDSIQTNQIYISINGYAINPLDLGDADVEISIGGDAGETRSGKGGGKEVLYKDDKIDSIKFTLRGSSSMVYKLQQYHQNHVDITSLIVKDQNPSRQRSFETDAAHVKSIDDVSLTDASAWAFTIECVNNFKVG